MEWTLAAVEEELQPLVQEKRATWPRMAELMIVTDVERLWEQGEHESFTKWLEYFAEQMGVTSGYLWQVLKAGRAYADYQDRAEEAGVSTVDMSDLSVSAEALALCDKISCSDPEVADKYIKKVLDGDISTQELKEVWQDVKERKEKAEATGTEVDTTFLKTDTYSAENEFKVRAKKALKTKWLEASLSASSSPHLQRGTVEKTRAKVISGVQVNGVKLPELIIENCSGQNETDIKIHAVAIGNVEDQSIPRYVNYCWVLTDSDYNTPDGWGVLKMIEVYDEKKEEQTWGINVEEWPKPQKATSRDELIIMALLK